MIIIEIVLGWTMLEWYCTLGVDDDQLIVNSIIIGIIGCSLYITRDFSIELEIVSGGLYWECIGISIDLSLQCVISSRNEYRMGITVFILFFVAEFKALGMNWREWIYPGILITWAITIVYSTNMNQWYLCFLALHYMYILPRLAHLHGKNDDYPVDRSCVTYF